ncbi:MAG: primosomal replication protein [Gammaproteobacteria bacterium]|nr:primosomal replication protein [Gammaproteobacteria bacterium]
MIAQLSEIERLLAQLSQKSTQYDLKSKIPSLAHRPIFDDKLFKNQSPRLYDYVSESYRLLEEIRSLISHKSATSLLQYQCNKLVDQCQAISKALASQQQRNASYQHEKATRKTVAIKKQQQTGSFAWIAGNIISNSVELYQELSKHHGYQQKLELKINQLDQQLSLCPINKKLPLQKDILKQHKRLGQCRKAIYFIEQKIELLEHGKLRKKS